MTRKQAEETEAMIQAKGKTAPHLTLDKVEATIEHEFYINVSADTVDAHDKPIKTPTAMTLLTICVLVLKNGFTIVGKSDCVSPENFDEEIGKKVAKDDAVRQIWTHEGYLLRQTLYEADRH